MARITEDLIRKCAEHNECEIFSLEELSLHQRNITKIEHLDRWCRDLKILYLHNNLISKIENLGRLKKLEYINFTLNNITRIENLEGKENVIISNCLCSHILSSCRCESLKKLDFTVNFIGDLASIESLKENYYLEELYLTGNPCVDYEGYREFVLASLPQLKILDGQKIKPSERIIAMQKHNTIRREVLEQQRSYLKRVGKSDKETSCSLLEDTDEISNTQSNDSFWKQPTSHTPQTRIEIYKHMEKSRYKDNKTEEKKPKRPRILFAEDGRPLNINEPKLNFEFSEDEENNCFKLDLGVYRYLSTCLLEADVQPNYVRVLVKGKVFQLHLPKEVQPDLCTSLRSQTTGHLLITMPKVEEILKSKVQTERKSVKTQAKSEVKDEKNTVLEVTSSVIKSLSSIVTESNDHHTKEHVDDTKKSQTIIPEFFDNPEVPPLI